MGVKNVNDDDDNTSKLDKILITSNSMSEYDNIKDDDEDNSVVRRTASENNKCVDD